VVRLFVLVKRGPCLGLLPEQSIKIKASKCFPVKSCARCTVIIYDLWLLHPCPWPWTRVSYCFRLRHMQSAFLLRGCHFKARGTKRPQSVVGATCAIRNDHGWIMLRLFSYNHWQCGFMRIYLILTQWKPNYFWCRFLSFLVNMHKKGYE